jgi:hypothetical protein
MEQSNYILRFRWFVSLDPDDAVWVPTVFTKNHDRLLDIATSILQGVLADAARRELLSDDHFTVTGRRGGSSHPGRGGLMAKLRHRGREPVAWVFTFTTAVCNLVRMRSLVHAGVGA